MNCVFCGKESPKRWHLDCFDEVIENEFGTDVYLWLLEQSLVVKQERLPNWVLVLIKEGVGEGRRIKTLFKLFATMSALGFSKEVIVEKLREFNGNCRPPLPDREVEYHIRYLTGRFFGRKKTMGEEG